MRAPPRCLTILACLALCWAGTPLSAQSPRRFVPIEMPGDVEQLVRARLQQAQELEPLKQLLEKFHLQAGAAAFDPDAIRKLGGQGPDVEKLLRQWAGRDGVPSPEKLRELQKQAQELLQKQQAPAQPAPPGEAGPANPPHEEGMARWLLHRMEHEDLGGLRQSAPFQRAVERMREAVAQPGAAAEPWFSRLVPDELPWQVGERLAQKLGDMDWSGPWHLELPAVPGWQAPRLPAGQRLPSVPPFAPGRLGYGILILLLIVLLGCRPWPRGRRSALGEDSGLGPWPVQPDAVASRAELIQAFDYLALRTIGSAARSWHHRAVAARWSQTPGCAAPAQAIAELYEESRYTAAAPLTADQSARARHDLMRLVAELGR